MNSLQLKLDDVEVEQLHPGAIIHLFPDKDAFEAIEDIIKGLKLIKNIENVIADMDQQIKVEEQPQYILMAFAEVKRILEKSRKDAERFSLKFMEEKNFQIKS